MTGNALDKLGNAIKDGDAKEVLSLLRGILEGFEDKVDNINDLFEDKIDKDLRDVTRQVARVKRRLIRETRAGNGTAQRGVRREDDRVDAR